MPFTNLSERLLTEAKKIAARDDLAYYIANPQEDPLATGPLGIRLISLQPSDTVVAHTVIPYFMPVMMAHFRDVLGDEYIGDTQQRWREVQGEVMEESDDDFLKYLPGKVDAIVREAASGTFKHIVWMQSTGILVNEYNPAMDIKSFFDSFFQRINDLLGKGRLAQLLKRFTERPLYFHPKRRT
jgi:hypothetical protein